MVMKRRVLCTKPTPALEIEKIPNESLSEGVESEPTYVKRARAIRSYGGGVQFVFGLSMTNLMILITLVTCSAKPVINTSPSRIPVFRLRL